MSEPTMDVLDSPALGILLALEADGFVVTAAGDRLRIKPISKLTPERRADLERYRSDLLLLLRICDDGVQARREVFVAQIQAAGESFPSLVFRAGTTYTLGICYSCGEGLPHPRHGRCWRCALAARLACHAPVPVDLMAALDEARVA